MPRQLLVLWAAVGIGGIVANIVVSLQADRMAHRRRLGAMAHYFEHVLVLPFSFHNTQHSGRLLKIMLTGVDHLFGIWLSASSARTSRPSSRCSSCCRSACS